MADEIKLAADTLNWLNGLKDEQIPEEVRPRMRDLVANLCDFQYGFSLPLDLGLNSNSFASETLPITRPIQPLLRWKNAFEVDASQVQSFESDDIEKVGEHVYCLVGGLTWQTLVEEGKITGEGASEARLEASDWMVDLFDIFGFVADSGGSQLKASARRLAACWYPVAMVVDFEAVSDEDMVQLSKEEVMAMMLGGMGLGEYEEDEEFGEDGEGEDGEYIPKASMAELLAQGLEEDGEDEDFVPAEEGAAPEDNHVSRRKALAAALMAGELAEDDDDEDYDPTKDENDDGEDIDGDIPDEDLENGATEDDEAEDDEEAFEEETEEERLQRAEEFRVRVLSSVEKLGAQWPHIEDQAWLKRVLKLMSIADEERGEWFPWGVPALSPLQKSAESSDELERTHGNSILALYKEREAVNASSPQ